MNKKIMKERSKDVKKYLTRLTGIARATYDTEMTRRHKDKIAINEFKKKQELKLAKAKLYKDINNRKSEKYLKKAREQFISIYSNRTVYKNPDGTFTVTRHYYNG